MSSLNEKHDILHFERLLICISWLKRLVYMFNCLGFCCYVAPNMIFNFQKLNILKNPSVIYLYILDVIPEHDPNWESDKSVIRMLVPSHWAVITNKSPCLALIDCLNALISQSQFNGLALMALKTNHTIYPYHLLLVWQMLICILHLITFIWIH